MASLQSSGTGIRGSVALPGRGVGQAAFLLTALCFWQFGSGRLFNRYYAGTPTELLKQIYDWLLSGYLPTNLLATLVTTAIGFLVAAITGLAIAVALVMLPLAQRILAPFLDAAFALPKIVLAPLFVVWLGIGFPPSVAMSAISGVFFVLYYSYNGLSNVSPQLQASVRLVGANRLQVLTKVLLPAASPSILTGLNQGLIYCFHGTIVGEMTASNEGIGYLIVFSATEMNVPGVLASVAVLAIVSLLLIGLLRGVARRLPGSIDHARA